MNEHDSERMKGMLESLGYEESADRESADLILFNTCSIRESADQRFIGHLGEAKRVKSQRPDVVVGVGGCWAQSLKDEVFERFPFVDVAFGPGQVHKLAEFLVSDSLTAQGYFGKFSPSLDGERTLIDVVGTYNVTSALTLILNVDWDKQDFPGGPSATWKGVAGYVNYAITDQWREIGRASCRERV